MTSSRAITSAVVQAATELGIPSDRPAVRSAARKVLELSPRYQFRLRVAPGSFVSGTVDRYSITVSFGSESEFPQPARSRFIRFLECLRLGDIRVQDV